jgi:hypothetical protein
MGGEGRQSGERPFRPDESIIAAPPTSDRIAALQRAMGALAGALTPADVARVTVTEVVTALGGASGILVVVDEARENLVPTATAGQPSAITQRANAFPIGGRISLPS